MRPKLGKCHIRLINEADYSTLVHIYLEHEGVDVPLGYFESFKSTLRDEGVIYFVAESDGCLVGGGGLAGFRADGHASLTFGIVERSKCRMGYGTSILLSRLFFLSSIFLGCQVSIEATKWSSDFFSRIGFKWEGYEEDNAGNRLLHGSQTIYPNDKKTFQQLLDLGGVTFDRTFTDLIQASQPDIATSGIPASDP